MKLLYVIENLNMGVNQLHMVEIAISLKQENAVYNPFGYRGEYTDSESGLIYLRARMYDPETGRFINEDPIKDGYNWYIYCAGNPVMFVDHSGLYYINTDTTTCLCKLCKLGTCLILQVLNRNIN